MSDLGTSVAVAVYGLPVGMLIWPVARSEKEADFFRTIEHFRSLKPRHGMVRLFEAVVEGHRELQGNFEREFKRQFWGIL